MSNKSQNEAARRLLAQNAEFAALFNYTFFQKQKIKPEELMLSSIDYSCLSNDPQIEELKESIAYSVTKSYGRCDLLLLAFFDKESSNYFTQQGKVILESLCLRQQLMEFGRVEMMRPVIITGIYLGPDYRTGGVA